MHATHIDSESTREEKQNEGAWRCGSMHRYQMSHPLCWCVKCDALRICGVVTDSAVLVMRAKHPQPALRATCATPINRNPNPFG